MKKGRYRKTNKTKITTKNALSKSELRAAREEINKSISTVREPNIKEKESEEKIQMTDYNCYNDDIISEFNSGKSIPDIVATFDISEEYILKVIVPYKYTNGLSILELHDELGLSKYKISKILNETNTKIRPRGCQIKREKAIEDINVAVNDNIENDIVINNCPDTDDSSNSITFCGQEIKDNNYRKISFNMFENDIFVAGLCKGRHDIPMVNKYIFDTLSDKEFKNPIYLENRAKGFINAYIKNRIDGTTKTLVLYCTGLQLPLSALIKVCVEMKVNLITMHFDPETTSYIPQVTLDIFGEVPDISKISPVDGLKNKYRGGVYTYKCNIKDLITQGNCIAIALNSDNDSNDEIILFDKEFPDAELWEVYGNFIKMSRDESIENKHHSIIMTTINISLAGYLFGDCISKSFNYKNPRKQF